MSKFKIYDEDDNFIGEYIGDFVENSKESVSESFDSSFGSGILALLCLLAFKGGFYKRQCMPFGGL
ncbi:MAG: hypothetical protein E7390_04735 [Ruminococcaceae bacterium]|nr:hypothetical protein [Oscillospiraceae bacterium]